MARFEYEYPHPAVATDCVVLGFDGRELKVLLVQRGVEPFKGLWAFPGGFMRMDETAEECARRELLEETGLHIEHIRQLGAFSGVQRDPRERVVSVAFYALARQSAVRGGDDAAHARWWPLQEVPQLAFDHDYILRQAMQRVRQDIHFEPIGFGLLEEVFTIADLQRLYECILGVRFDRRNFHRKMLQTGILKEWKVESGEWKVESGERKVESGKWKVESGKWKAEGGKRGVESGKWRVESGQRADAGSQFFGARREMRTQDIDALFGAVPPGEKGALPEPAPLPAVEEEAMPLPVAMAQEGTAEFSPSDREAGAAEEALGAAPHGAGRKGRLFRFDSERYARLKQGGFRLEF